MVVVGQERAGQLTEEELEAPGQDVNIVLLVRLLEGVPLALVNIYPDLLNLGRVSRNPIDPLCRKILRLALDLLNTFPEELWHLREIYTEDILVSVCQ